MAVLKKIKKLTLERFAELVMDEFGKVHQRLDTMDARADRSEARLDRMEARLDQIEVYLGVTDGRLGTIAKEIDMLIHRVTAIERRLDAERAA